MRRYIVVTTASLTIVGILFTGCNQTANREETPGANATASSSTPVEGNVTERDRRISSIIHNHLEVDKDISYSGKMISISTANGVVVLDGVVHNEGDHQKILSITRKVDGVERIDDRIAIQ